MNSYRKNKKYYYDKQGGYVITWFQESGSLHNPVYVKDSGLNIRL